MMILLTNNVQFLLQVLCLLNIFATKAEIPLYTAVSSIIPLIESEHAVINKLSQYIDKEEEKLKIIKNYIKVYKETYKLTYKLLNNPMSRFKVISSLRNELQFLESIIEENSGFCVNSILRPNKADLRGAVLSIRRVHTTYEIDAADMARGLFKGMSCLPMLPSDCYELGQHLFAKKDFRNSIMWFKESLNFDDEDEEYYGFTKTGVIEHISYGYHAQEDYSNALLWLQFLLKYRPHHENNEMHLQTINFYKQALASNKLSQTKSSFVDHARIQISPKVTRLQSTKTSLLKKQKKEEEIEQELFLKLCNNESTTLYANVAKKLKCRYLKETHPFLKLAPLKMEELYLNPDVFLFYGLISKEEIKAIKEHVAAELGEVNIYGKKHRSEIRVGKSVWIDRGLKIMEKVSKRAAQCTGMDIHYSEPFQASNYGIGGYFGPHLDFFTHVDGQTDNRIGSLLFYLSEIKQGGATVFTELNLKIDPVLGAAIYFSNLLQTGEGDYYTKHASCPVLDGNKWILVKWFRYIGQELHKPCDINYVPYYKKQSGLLDQLHGYRHDFS